MNDLRKLSEFHKNKLEKIKVFLTDVDGVLTDGRLYWSGEEVGWNRFFHAHDGYGLKMLMKAGIHVGILSGGQSLGLRKRIENLNIPFYEIGEEDKLVGFEKVLSATEAKAEETIYIGDEFFDLPLLKKVGFSVTVPDASLEIQECVDYVTKREGGKGAVREVVDMLRYAQNIVPIEMRT